MASFDPRHPTDFEMEVGRRLLAPWKALTSPTFHNLSRLPHRPYMLVSHHTVLGVFDLPLLVMEIFRLTGNVLQGMGDHDHFKIPLWGRLLRRYGVVDGTRENCRMLMKAGQHLLIYPGGGREVFKRKGEKYQLLWKKRTGFARLAIEQRYPIVPVAAVGGEEFFDIAIDGNDVLNGPLGSLIKRLNPRQDIIFPVVRGLGGLPWWLPRPCPLYFSAAEPIETEEYDGACEDEDAVWDLRERVRLSLEDEIGRLLELRAAVDPGMEETPTRGGTQ